MCPTIAVDSDKLICLLCHSNAPPVPSHSDFGQYARTYFGFNACILCLVCGEECCQSCFGNLRLSIDNELHCPNSNCKALLPLTQLERDKLLVQCAESDTRGSVKYKLAQSIGENSLNEGVLPENVMRDIHSRARLFEKLILEACYLGYSPAQIAAGGLYLSKLQEYGLEESTSFVGYNESNIQRGDLKTDEDMFVQIKVWFEQARKQGHPSAETCLGNLYNHLPLGDVNKALEYYESAASKGCSDAAYSAGIIYRDKWRDVSSSWLSSSWLNCKEQSKETPSKLLSQAIKYFQQGAEKFRPDAQVCLSFALIDEAKMKYIDDEIPGKSPIPQSRFWAFSSLKHKPLNGYDEAIRETAEHFIESSEERLKVRCAGCDHIDEDGFEFKCSRCKSAFYCSNQCQKRHWKVGHKLDCCDLSSVYVNLKLLKRF